jgi:hypothetical protein
MAEYSHFLVQFGYYSGSFQESGEGFIIDPYYFFSSYCDPLEKILISDEQKNFTIQNYANVAIIYRMKAYNSSIGEYVYWYARQNPDLTGKFSGYLLSELSDIQIQNRRII